VAQEIKIPVSAQTGGAEKAVDQLAGAFDGVADAVGSIDKKARAASTSIKRLADDLRQVKAAQAFLSKSLGHSVSDADSKAFLGNFQAAGQRGPASRGIRAFGGDFINWSQGHSTMYRGRAAAHRSMVLGMGMSGTEYAGQYGTPGPGFGGGGGGAPSGGGFNGSVNSAKSAALGFGKSMLALAGITSIMGMAGKALDMATEEAVGNDTLKRRMGDLGVDFTRLREKARQSGSGLGLGYVETNRLNLSYAKEVGNISGSDGLTGARVGWGISRAYGLDPEVGNQFAGSMAKYGVAKDEAGQKRLALMIGDAVARSGYSGKVDELLSAVSDYTATNSRATLSATNVGGFTSAITSLMSKGYPGMGPNEAGALLGSADSALRRGGMKGEASQNFIFNAMRNFTPGLSAVESIGLMEGGLFASTQSTFGSGPLKGMGPAHLDGMTTLEKVMKTIRARAGTGKDARGYMAESLKGVFGGTQAQMMALADMDLAGQTGQSMALLSAAGAPLDQVSLTAMPMIAKLAAAKGRKGIMDVGNLVNARGDLSPEVHAQLADAMKGGSDEDVRKALARVISKLDQEGTDGDKTRQSVVDLNNALTSGGASLLGVTNAIRDAVVALAMKLAPNYMDTSHVVPASQDAVGALGNPRGNGKVSSDVLKTREQLAMKFLMGKGLSRIQAAGVVGTGVSESNLSPDAGGDMVNGVNQAQGIFQWHPQRWNAFLGWAKSKGKDPYDAYAQLEYQMVEPGQNLSRNHMGRAVTARDSTVAMLDFEKPKFYTPAHPENSMNYRGRLAATEYLATDKNFAPQSLEHNINLNIIDPFNNKTTFKVPPIGAPKAAGASPTTTAAKVAMPAAGQ
jgi:hypothetical protein